jgi:hypothetical protein
LVKLPISFPSDEGVIREEAARFRAMSPEERMRALRSVLSAGFLVMLRSPKAKFLREHAEEQERLNREALKEFLARHAG